LGRASKFRRPESEWVCNRDICNEESLVTTSHYSPLKVSYIQSNNIMYVPFKLKAYAKPRKSRASPITARLISSFGNVLVSIITAPIDSKASEIMFENVSNHPKRCRKHVSPDSLVNGIMNVLNRSKSSPKSTIKSRPKHV
jgi:hypothetical protein